ncbi:glycosyltransferase family 4 protein [Thiohalorhabdus sp. Cl-TMA]|uniref:Glycosyltransferase family 4 protein n=1 Tax=Thiohalorhabdus methylotrophus TaxID=3242694 RepID=A0ABV4TVC8_9GAMM
MAERLQAFDVLALIRSGDRESAQEELGPEVPLREVGDGPLRQLPEDLDHSGNILFLALGANFLEGQGGRTRARLVVVEHGFRYQDKAYSISDHLCHPLLGRGFWKGVLCTYSVYLRKKRLRHAMSRVRRRFEALKDGDRVVCPSRHSQYALYLDLGSLVPGREERFRDEVGLLPPLTPFVPDGGPDRDNDRGGILLLSANRLVKNAERFLEGIARHEPSRQAANREGIDLVGADEACRRRLRRRFGNVLNLRFHPYVQSEQLQDFIRNARIMAFPTLSEGYGIPPVEAFKWGTPVLASAVTSVPEVVGGAAMLADPLQPTEMANRLLQLLADPELRNAKSEEGRKRYERLREETFSCWDRFVHEIDQPYPS